MSIHNGGNGGNNDAISPIPAKEQRQTSVSTTMVNVFNANAYRDFARALRADAVRNEAFRLRQHEQAAGVCALARPRARCCSFRPHDHRGKNLSSQT